MYYFFLKSLNNLFIFKLTFCEENLYRGSLQEG